MSWRTSLRTLALALLMGTSAAAQQRVDAPQWEKVDQASEDLDLRAQSFRRIEPGLSVFDEDHLLERRTDYRADKFWPSVDPQTGQLASPQYRLRAPGLEVQMRRPPDYLVKLGPGRFNTALNVAPYREGAFEMLLPTDAVYVLTPEPRPLIQPRDPASRVDWQVRLEPVQLQRAAGQAITGPPALIEHSMHNVPSPLARIKQQQADESSPATQPADE